MTTSFTFKAGPFSWLGDHNWGADAVELGLAPGVTPDTITIEGLGNGQPFDYTGTVCDGGGFRYRQRLGVLVAYIWNT